MIKVLIADDHAVVREGIKRIIEETDDILVAAEAADGQELLARVKAETCDLVLLDLSMPGGSWLDFMQGIRRARPSLPILVLSIHPEEQYATRVLAEGASGFVNKESPPEEILKAIRVVAAGRKYITPKLAEILASQLDRTSARPPHESLSQREHQVFLLLASGRSVGEIARELSLSVKTISTFRSRIVEKLGVRTNAELARYAIKHGLTD